MNEIVYSKSYSEYRYEVGAELSKASESFVRIGYLLKVARDTEVLNGTDYEGDYLRFAEEEFGLEKSQVSRFIRINDRFSVNGNSEELLPEYSGYGTRKLGIMIMLPDELTEELSPDYTVEEINEIKEVVKEEQQITPVEAMVERMGNPEADEKPLIDSCLYQILEDNPDIFVEICKNSYERLYKTLAPISEQMYIVKVQGVGRIMVTFHDENITLFNARTNEKQTVDRDKVESVVYAMMALFANPKYPEESYQAMFNKVIPKIEEPKKEAKKELRVKNATKQKTDKKADKKAEKTDKAVGETNEEGNVSVGGRSDKDDRAFCQCDPSDTSTGGFREEYSDDGVEIEIEQIRAAVLNFYHYSYLDNILKFLDEENVEKALGYLKTDIKRLNDVKDIMEQYKPNEE